MSTKAEMIDCALKARELIARDGWIKGFAKNHEGYCVVGAVRFAAHPEGNTCRLTYSVLSAIQKLIGPPSHWNDKPERTKEEVLQMFDSLIVRLRE